MEGKNRTSWKITVKGKGLLGGKWSPENENMS